MCALDKSGMVATVGFLLDIGAELDGGGALINKLIRQTDTTDYNAGE